MGRAKACQSASKTAIRHQNLTNIELELDRNRRHYSPRCNPLSPPSANGPSNIVRLENAAAR
jgi:hypothetical protein